MDYVALHNHSYYSLLDSTMAPEQLVEAAVAMKMPAIGLVDHDTVAGAVQFYKKARAAGVRPIIGSQIRTAAGHSLVLLVENPAGYKNLCRLLSLPPSSARMEDLHRHRRTFDVMWPYEISGNYELIKQHTGIA